jgi:hypothetical protein
MKPLFYLLIISVLYLKPSKVDHQAPIRLMAPPQLIATELDFGTDAITFCMHEGTKVRFRLVLGELEFNDIEVRVVSGQIDLKKRTEVAGVYLVNPKAEEFEVEVWVKIKEVDQIKVPVVEGKVVDYNTSGEFNTTNAKWKPLIEMYEVEGAYVKVISNWKLYGRVCE